MNFKIGESQLTARFKVRQTKTYTIKNRSTKERTIIIEHPIRSDWKLIDPEKPLERPATNIASPPRWPPAKPSL